MVQVKNEQCIVIRTKLGKVVLTNPVSKFKKEQKLECKINFEIFSQDEIGLKEWALSLKSAHKCTTELLGSMAKKAGKIYGTESEQSNNKAPLIPTGARNTNGN